MTTNTRLELGLKKVDALTLNIERLIAFFIILFPFLGILVAGFLLQKKLFSLLDFTLLISMYLFTGFGITAGFHRLLTHDSFTTPTWLRALFAIAGSMALQGPVVRWVADHRKHHAFSDQEGDPHSPYVPLEGGKFKNLFYGFVSAHCGWFFNSKKTRLRRFVPDLFNDPVICWVDRHYFWWMALSLGFAPLVAYILTGSLERAAQAFVWGSLVRIFLVDHVTWSINSVCHVFGKRPFESGDKSVNCWWLAIPSLGESWHNGHHAFPRSATHGLLPGEIDLSSLLISALEKLGLAKKVNRPSAQQIQDKKRPL